MHLSTFSFKSFVGQSLLVGSALVMLYVVVIQCTVPEITFSQNQNQANTIFSQNFIYLKDKPSNVVVGSSMAARLKFNKEDDIYNLSFGGGGPLSGLEIIRRSGSMPKSIFIESNVFTMDADEDFLNTLFTPVLFKLRGKVIALQEKYQVLNIVGNILYKLAGRSQKEILAQKVDKILLDKFVNQNLNASKTLKINQKLLEEWKKNIAYFEKQGIKLMFFEMPNDSRLVKTKKREILRKAIKKSFPNIEYREENNTDDLYKTGDGTHLTLQSAMEFTEYFKDIILK